MRALETIGETAAGVAIGGIAVLAVLLAAMGRLAARMKGGSRG